ncbi:unnamed protein product [Gemmataceae bacterium]|nr:unnamed protein product [Gemmataceae bacterium]VTT99077.1 unnamed protein product [Gemmataceae bacterium]
MPARKPARPLGREDHRRRVAAVEDELDRLLKGIAGDPAAGPWTRWAVKLLAEPQHEQPTPSPAPGV